ncbi:NRDE family protein [Desulfotomaculum sp. 1211_IL3151]|uniref:NRDE family protein n=1 Tax=Desulfotomaculum sp. 1211_IL3151 TaxID=3084055 RepID=UPI002FD90C23
MCLILFATNCHPQYRLVLASNRDEFYGRPTRPAAFWYDHKVILAGKDLKQGGTWLGLTTTGRFSSLTNYRDPARFNSQAPSRGHLVYQYLSGAVSPENYINSISSGVTEFNGFNLLMGSTKGIYYYSNLEKVIRKVDSGIHGLSNSFLDVPWPKVSKGKKALADCLQSQTINKEQLFAIMADREQPEDHRLPQTGLSLEWERIMSPAFVVSSSYGTKCSTVVLVDHHDHVQYWERSFVQKDPSKWQDVFFEFDIEEQRENNPS